MASSAVSLQLPRRLSGKEFICQCRRCGLDPWVRKVSWKRKCQLSPVFLPGEFHGQKSLVCCSLRGCKELDTTGQLGSHACMQLVPEIRFVRTKPALVNPAGVWLQEAKLSFISRCYSLKPITALTWCHAFSPAPADDWVVLRQGHSFERLFPSDGRPSSAWLVATQTFLELLWRVKLLPPTCLPFFDPSL